MPDNDLVYTTKTEGPTRGGWEVMRTEVNGGIKHFSIALCETRNPRELYSYSDIDIMGRNSLKMEMGR